MQLYPSIFAERIMENNPNQNLSLQIGADIERLNQTLPILIQPENRSLMPNESAQIYYARLEPFRRLCEARTVLRWLVGAYFDSAQYAVDCHRADYSVACYLSKVTAQRGQEAASILKSDVLDLYHSVIDRDPSLQDLLGSQLRLLE